MTYNDCVATIAMIVAVIAVPATGYLSYYFAIKGEKGRSGIRYQYRLERN